MDHVANFRDLTGMPVARGEPIRRDIFFRSSTFCVAPRDVLERFTTAVGAGTYIDLRTQSEVSRDGSVRVLRDLGWEVVQIPIYEERRWPDVEGWGDAALESYRASMQYYIPGARTVVETVKPNRPTVVACSLGKDRTGLVVGLILKWLGVPDAEIAKDFELSNEALRAGRTLLVPRFRERERPFHTVSGATLLRAIEPFSVTARVRERLGWWFTRASEEDGTCFIGAPETIEPI